MPENSYDDTKETEQKLEEGRKSLLSDKDKEELEELRREIYGEDYDKYVYGKEEEGEEKTEPESKYSTIGRLVRRPFYELKQWPAKQAAALRGDVEALAPDNTKNLEALGGEAKQYEEVMKEKEVGKRPDEVPATGGPYLLSAGHQPDYTSPYWYNPYPIKATSINEFENTFVNQRFDYLEKTLTSGERSRVGQRTSELVSGGMTTSTAHRKALIEEIKGRDTNKKDIIDALKVVENAEIFKTPEDFGESPEGFWGGVEDLEGAIFGSIPDMAAYFASPILGTLSTFQHIKGASLGQNEAALMQKFPDMSEEERFKIAYKAATVNAALQTPLEAVGDLIKLKALMGKAMFRKVSVGTLEAFLGEGLTEFIQEYPEELSFLRAINPDLTREEFIEFAKSQIGPITKRALYAGWIGGLSGVSMTTAHKIIDNTTSEVQRRMNAAKAVDDYEIGARLEAEQATEEDNKTIETVADVIHKQSNARTFSLDALNLRLEKDQKALARVDNEIEVSERLFQAPDIGSRDAHVIQESSDDIERQRTLKKTIEERIENTKKAIEELDIQKQEEVPKEEIHKEEGAPPTVENKPSIAEQLDRMKIVEETRKAFIRNKQEIDEQSKVIKDLTGYREPDAEGVVKEWDVDEILTNVGQRAIFLKQSPLPANIRWERIHSEEQIAGIISRLSRNHKEDVENSGVSREEYINRLAKDINVRPNKFARSTTGKNYTVADAYVAKKLIEASGENIKNLVNNINKLESKSRAFGLKELKLRVALQKHAALVAHVSGIQSKDTNKSLQKFNVGTINSVETVNTAVSRLLDERFQSLPFNDLMDVLKRAVDKDGYNSKVNKIITNKALNKAVDNVSKVRWHDYPMEIIINSMLSGPITHVANILSNTINTGTLLFERSIAGLNRRVINEIAHFRKVSEFEKKLSELSENDRDNVRFQPGTRRGEDLKAWVGFGNGVVNALQIIRNEYKNLLKAKDLSENVNRRGSKLEGRRKKAFRRLEYADTNLSLDPGNIGNILKNGAYYIWNSVNTPTEALNLMDAVFHEINYQVNRHAESYRLAIEMVERNEDLAEGEVSNKAINERVSNQYAEILDNEDAYQTIKLNSRNYAEYAIFTNNLESDFGQGLTRILNGRTFVSKLLKLNMPFIRTPTNILKFTFERIPLLNMLSMRYTKDLMGMNGRVKQDIAVAKMTTGVIVSTIAAYFSHAGYLTGGGPSDERVRKILMRTGWRPYSLRIGDTYYSYERLEPLSSVVGTVIDTIDLMSNIPDSDDEDDEKKNSLAVGAYLVIERNLLSKSFLTDLSNLVNVLTHPERENYLKRYINKLESTPVPSLAKTVEKKMDPVKRAYYEYSDAFKANIPGLSKDLPPRRNIWGEEEIATGSSWLEIFTSIAASKEKADPIDEEMYRLGLVKEMPSRTLTIGPDKSIELTPWEYDRLILMGNNVTFFGDKTLKEYLNDQVTDEDSTYNFFEKNSEGDEMRRALISTIINDARRYARITLAGEINKNRRTD